jgi:hypothetical protein
MIAGQQYPPHLAEYVVEHWPKATPLRFSREVLCEALSVCFQASMTSEEGRPTRFRLLLTSPDELPESGVPNQSVLRLVLDRNRPFSADELRRLSPSAPFEVSLIGAHVKDARLRIWGLAHSGPAWLAPAWGGRSVVPNWTYDPIVHVAGPGRLAVRCAGELIGGLERGTLVDTAMDVFESNWLPELFVEAREDVRQRHAVQHTSTPAPTAIEHSLIRNVSQHMIRRAIQLVRGSHHGGMILVVDEGRGLDGLRIKYGFEDLEPAHRYQALLFQILEQLAQGTTKESVGWSDFVNDLSPDLAKIESSIFEISRLIAGLAAIDGAVVLNKRFDLLGFGAEVSGELPIPTSVYQALDVEGREKRCEPVENVGTRHRAAYRFAQAHPRGLALVISQDGAVRFVANRAGELTYWEQSLSP